VRLDLSVQGCAGVSRCSPDPPTTHARARRFDGGLAVASPLGVAGVGAGRVEHCTTSSRLAVHVPDVPIGDARAREQHGTDDAR
jgi:hypothetical protein